MIIYLFLQKAKDFLGPEGEKCDNLLTIGVSSSWIGGLGGETDILVNRSERLL